MQISGKETSWKRTIEKRIYEPNEIRIQANDGQKSRSLLKILLKRPKLAIKL